MPNSKERLDSVVAVSDGTMPSVVAEVLPVADPAPAIKGGGSAGARPTESASSADAKEEAPSGALPVADPAPAIKGGGSVGSSADEKEEPPTGALPVADPTPAPEGR